MDPIYCKKKSTNKQKKKKQKSKDLPLETKFDFGELWGKPTPNPENALELNTTTNDINKDISHSSTVNVKNEEPPVIKENADLEQKLEVLSLNSFTESPLNFPASYVNIIEEEYYGGGSGEGGDEEEGEFNEEEEDTEWQGEEYEQSAHPEGYTDTFQQFCNIVQENPQQCIRYQFRGSPLLFTDSDVVGSALSYHSDDDEPLQTTAPPKKLVPDCPFCGQARVFEMQLMPNLLRVLPVSTFSPPAELSTTLMPTTLTPTTLTKSPIELPTEQPTELVATMNEGIEFGTVLIYVCSQDCGPQSEQLVQYLEEIALIQVE